MTERTDIGHLTVILGYAPGVGKTYRMLEEAQRLTLQGRHVVIGYFESHGRKETMAKAEGLFTIPRKHLSYRGCCFAEMDTEAILARRPEVVLVDELAHSNVPGSLRTKRWEDVLILLAAGIDVWTTLNIQHLESLNDSVRVISGVQVRETVPDWVLQRANEVVLVDLTPGALLNRMDRGVVYSSDKVMRAKANFFKQPTLAALRELALRQTAHAVDLGQPAPWEGVAMGSQPKERILIHVTESPSSVGLIRRGRRVADYMRGECFAVAVVGSSGEIVDRLAQHLDFARRLHIETRVLLTEMVAETLLGFASTNGITQIFLAKPTALRRRYFRRTDLLAIQMVGIARNIQVIAVAERRGRLG